MSARVVSTHPAFSTVFAFVFFLAGTVQQATICAPRELGKTVLRAGAKNLSFSGIDFDFPKIRNPEGVLRFLMHFF